MRKIPTTDSLLVLCHWAAAISLGVSLLSGLRIAADNPNAVLSPLLSFLLPQGGIYQLHLGAGLVLAATSAAYWVYLRRMHLSRLRLPPKLGTVLAQGGHKAWRAVNRLVQQTIYLLVAVLAATGLCFYFGIPLPFGITTDDLALVHVGAAWALLAITVLHVAGEYMMGAAVASSRHGRLRSGFFWLLKMLRPRLPRTRGLVAGLARTTTLQAHPATTVMAVGAAMVAGGGLYAYDRNVPDSLAVERIAPDQVPQLDGSGDDPVWRWAPAERVLTWDGANLPGGQSRVEVQAVSDGEQLYLKFRWEDPTQSFKHLPLQKTAAGWRLLHEQYDIEDEDLYYEDKFGVLLSTKDKLAGGVTHLGPKPLADKPAALSGRGLHYTDDGSTTDLWQWKAVRSQPLGFLDDDYIGPPPAPKPEEAKGTSRYKAGYQTDPGKASYKNNFGHQGPGGYREPVQPVRLPADLGALQARLGPANLDPHVGDAAPWAMSEAESVPYTPERDAAIPVGTVIPGIILGKRGFEGDRGDVRTAARWQDGYWTLEAVRKLDTGSAKDVALRPGQPVYMWVSVFDHTQTRHSRHVRPIRLSLSAGEA